MQNKSCIITGASGFVGQYLRQHFDDLNINYKACVREQTKPNDFICGDLLKFSDWSQLFDNAYSVVHLAGKAHDMSEPKLSEYLSINTELTKKIAIEAKKAKIKRFIFISTIKVNGEFTSDTPFAANDIPKPQDPYAISKYEAEKELLKLHEPGVFEVVIIRPCLIYGKNVKGNFQNLIRLVKKQLPLPLGSVNNKRSFLFIENLTDLITLCLKSQQASGQIFLASDDNQISFTDLLKTISKLLEIKILLIPIPVYFMHFFFLLTGKSKYTNRLFSNLHVDNSKTKILLDWKPPFTTFEGLKKMLL